MTMYVSNPRRGKRGVSRRNPSSDAKLKQLATDLARVSRGEAPLNRYERQAIALGDKINALNQIAATQRGFAGLVASQKGPAQLKVAIAAAEREAAREMSRALGSKGGKKRRKSTRRKARKGAARRTTRRLRNPLEFGNLLLSNPRRAKRRKSSRKGAKRRYTFKHTSFKSRKLAKSRRPRGHRVVRRNPGAGIFAPILALIGPMAMGAVAVEGIGQVTKLVSSRVAIPTVIQPFTYSLGGLAIAGALQFCTFIPAPLRHSLSLATASAGGAVDAYRYRSASGAYGDLSFGDGGNWDVEYGDLELADIEFGDIEDADFAGADFDIEEGEAAASPGGFGAYVRRFPLRPGHRTVAGAKGDRWRWLAKAAGPAGFQQIAQLPPRERVATIAALKQQVRPQPHAHPQIGMNPGFDAGNAPLPQYDMHANVGVI